jgi:hypothetical protein
MKYIICAPLLMAAAVGAPTKPYHNGTEGFQPFHEPHQSSPGHPMGASRPSNSTGHNFHVPRATGPDPVQQLLAIAPNSKDCAGATYPSECTTSSAKTVNAIIAGFTKYGVTTAPEQAALLSWMAFESADFKYNHNHFPAPGKPGQGTRCMMSPTYVQEYVASLPELAGPLAAAGGDPDKILALVQPDQYSFAAASWFYAKHCSDSVKAAVKTGSQAKWSDAFIKQCVGTSLEDGRVKSWTAAMKTLNAPITP